MEADPARMREILVDLLDVDIRGVEDRHRGLLTVHFEFPRVVVGCPECGVVARVKDRDQVTLVDLPMNSNADRVAQASLLLFRVQLPDGVVKRGRHPHCVPAPLRDRTGRCLTYQIGKCGRDVQEIADKLGCDWHRA